MAEVLRVRCRDCTRTCPATPIPLELIDYTFTKGYQKDREHLKRAFLLQTTFVQCQGNGVFYFVRAK